jgi:hypothetical protein
MLSLALSVIFLKRKSNFVKFQKGKTIRTQHIIFIPVTFLKYFRLIKFRSFLTYKCQSFFLVWEAIGTAATPGLLCQPRVIMKMIVEKQMECRLAGETEVLLENVPQCHFSPSQNPT